MNNNPLMIRTMTAVAVLVSGLGGSVAAQADARDLVNTHYFTAAYAEQDGESGYRLTYQQRTDVDMTPRWRFDLMSRDIHETLGHRRYERLQLGAGAGVRVTPSVYWNIAEAGWRADRYALVNTSIWEHGYYIATDYEQWVTSALGYRLRAQYADVDDSAGTDLRGKALYALTESLVLTAAYEVVNSGRVEEDILDVGVRVGW